MAKTIRKGSREPRYEPPSDLLELIEQVLDQCMTAHTDRQTEETFVLCSLCDEWDGHKDHCPVPVMSKFMNGGSK